MEAHASHRSPLVLIAADAVLIVFFLIIIIATPLLDSQVVLPPDLLPEPLVQIKTWYATKFDDYLVAEKHNFMEGLVWLELLFQWPLAIANLVGLIGKKRWVGMTCLLYGASCLTSMAAIMGELLLSGKATETLLRMYYPFLGLGVLAIARGLVAPPSTAAAAKSSTKLPGAKKKRV